MSEEVYCRLCAVKVEEFVKIYDEEGEKLSLSTKIIQCLQVWLYPEDVLPKTICNDCCNKVDLFYDFFQICAQAQISLMAIYKDKNEEGKEMISNDLEINEDTSFDRDYEEDCTIIDGGDIEDIEEVEYTELSVSEKCTVSSKRKLRTPIKHSLIDGASIGDVDLEKNKCMDDSCETTEKGMTTETKCSSLIGDEEGIEEEAESEDETKSYRRGMDGYIWRCTNCSAQLKTLTELRKHHSQVHNQPPVFACMHCSKSYTRYRSFARHVKMHSNPKNFSCEICGKSFSQKTVLQSHATVHSEERPHCCAQCGKTFKQFSSLYLHSKCHLPDQAKIKFPCPHCPKEFSTKHTLDTHLKIHTGERNFVCDVCGKRFIAKGSLDYHIMTHSDSKPHSCSVCGKGFMTIRLLKKHETLHTGVKPHQCDVCGKQFRERGALKEHNRIHTGAMPYACEYCGKLFRFKGILTVHRRQHTGERPYSCSECHREFTNWANYNKHMKRRHRTVQHERHLPRNSEDDILLPPPVLHPPHGTAADYNTPGDNDYKVLEDDHYRVHNYVAPMGYYMPPIQHALMPARQ